MFLSFAFLCLERKLIIPHLNWIKCENNQWCGFFTLNLENDSQINQYCDFGLLTTWARVQSNQSDGVEKYLADELDPIIGE
jgi:hypothetical protein